MKIIAKTGADDTFLVEMTAREIARMQGESYEISLPSHRRPAIGQTVNVHSAWEDLNKFRDAAGRLRQAAETLRAVAQISELASAAYVITPEPPAESPQQ